MLKTRKAKPETNGQAVMTAVNVPETCAELQKQQRNRVIIIKSRIMQYNRLVHIIAGDLGYRSGLENKEREKIFDQAKTLIKGVCKGTQSHDKEGIILATMKGVGAFDILLKPIQERMEQLAETLPVAAFTKNIRGFGKTSQLFLGIIVGETGDLSNYANPAKVWRRFGCAPWTYNDKTLMGATWRSGREGKLPSEEWEKFGYSPRRRSIAYLIGEGLMKQNQGGSYRKRFDESKAKIKELHPDYSDQRCHRHGMLLAAKMLLRDLWVEWNGSPARPGW